MIMACDNNILTNATSVHRGVRDNEHYYERTKRNTFWLGGREGQDCVHDLKVGVAGLGGMGSNIAAALARLGVGHIRVADPDIVERSNINRQIVANEGTIGKTKVQACVDVLEEIAKDIDIIAYEQGITEETVYDFCDGLDIIVDEIDVFPLDKHVLLHDEAKRSDIPIYSAYVVGLGVHMYKFYGDYTIRDFLGKNGSWSEPSAEYLVKTFGYPLPEYLNEETLDEFIGEISKGDVPIFGSSCLFGHAMVSMRVVLDMLHEKFGGGYINVFNYIPTPIMPKFIVIDPVTMSINNENFE